MKREKIKEEKEHISKEEFLEILKAGIGLLVAVTAPGALMIFKDSFKETPWEDYYPSSIKRMTYKLWRKGYVEIKEEESQTIVKLTDKGKVQTLKGNLESLAIKKPNRWDGRWRLVIFDIPEGEKKKREIFREKLKNLGFFQIQRSVFIYPYPCEDQIKFIREVLEIPHSIKLIRADRIENDEDLRKIFRL